MIDLSSLFRADRYLPLRPDSSRTDRARDEGLDAGCGRGRNLVFFLREAYEVRALDPDGRDRGRAVARRAARPAASSFELPAGSEWTPAPFPTAAPTSSFAAPFSTSPVMRPTSWRCFEAPGASSSPTASSFAASHPPSVWKSASPLGGRRYALPDGTDRFLVDEPYLLTRVRTQGRSDRPSEDHPGSRSPMHDDMGDEKGRLRSPLLAAGLDIVRASSL